MSSDDFSWVRCSEEGTVERGTSANRAGTDTLSLAISRLKEIKGFYRAVLESKELGVWGSLGRVPKKDGCVSSGTSGLPV